MPRLLTSAASLPSPNRRERPRIYKRFRQDANVVLHRGDCLPFLRTLPDHSVMLVITSPPYNVGKSYEHRTPLNQYLQRQALVIAECVRVLSPLGSICWQVGNHMAGQELLPLDTLLYEEFVRRGLQLRNRIVWTFDHGLNCKKRFSGRYETINWFTKTTSYKFNLDAVRVRQKYPGKKHYKGPRRGEYSSNPHGRNPGDVWNIPNVKHNHPEKTVHPCQFPLELVERCILAFSDLDDWVCDPYLGSGTTAAAAVLRGRRIVGAEARSDYVAIAASRVRLAARGALPRREFGKPIYVPPKNSSLLRAPWDETKRRDETSS